MSAHPRSSKPQQCFGGGGVTDEEQNGKKRTEWGKIISGPCRLLLAEEMVQGRVSNTKPQNSYDQVSHPSPCEQADRDDCVASHHTTAVGFTDIHKRSK